MVWGGSFAPGRLLSISTCVGPGKPVRGCPYTVLFQSSKYFTEGRKDFSRKAIKIFQGPKSPSQGYYNTLAIIITNSTEDY